MHRAALSLMVFVVLFSANLAAAAEPSPLVVTSFSILADLAKNVGGDAIRVQTLVGPNGDVHAFEPTPSDAKALGQAKLVIINGQGLEGWIERLIKTSGYKGKVCVASDGVKLIDADDADDDHDKKHKHEPKKADKHAHKHGSSDPHVWQDLNNAQRMVENIAAALVEIEPALKDMFLKNAESYKAKIRELDGWAKTQFAAIPEKKRRMITSHDALGYLGKAYDIDIHSPVGFSTESEPSAKQVAALIKQIKKDKISAIFIENVSDPRLVDQIAKESGVTMGGELYSDALSKAEGPAPTFLDMYKNNVQKILEAMKK